MISRASWIISFALSASLLLSLVVWGVSCIAPVDVYTNRRIAPVAARRAREQQQRVHEIAQTFVTGTMLHLNQMAHQLRPSHFKCRLTADEGSHPFSLDYSVTGPMTCLAERTKQDFRALFELHEQKIAGELADDVYLETRKLSLFVVNPK